MSKFIDNAYLQNVAEDILKKARNRGATAAELSLSRNNGIVTLVREQKAETIESIRDQALNLTVYFGTKKGSASSSDVSVVSIDRTIDKACAISKYTQGDEDFGLAEPNLLAKEHLDLNLEHPMQLDSIELENMAATCEQAALDYSSKVVNSEGASIDTSHNVSVYANSNGFNDYQKTTSYGLSCSAIAKNKSEMQRDYDFSVTRQFDTLADPKKIGASAGKKAVKKLGGKSIITGTYPVILGANIAASFWGTLIQAVSGTSLYHKTSFLLNSLNKKIFPEFVRIRERPLEPLGIASCAYDAEGVQTKNKNIVENGILRTYILNSYSARKLKMDPTANAGGVFNLYADANYQSQSELIGEMRTGLLITEFMGSGVNMTTGDYSRGASGFWIENSEIKFPVKEITIAGNLSAMYKNVVGLSADIDYRHNIKTGSVLLDKMMVSGN